MDSNQQLAATIGGTLLAILLFFSGYRIGHNSAEDSCRDYYADRSYTEVQQLCRDITWGKRFTK